MITHVVPTLNVAEGSQFLGIEGKFNHLNTLGALPGDETLRSSTVPPLIAFQSTSILYQFYSENVRLRFDYSNLPR